MSDDTEIEVVNGNGEELEISQVYEHLDIEKPNMEKKKDIVVPKVKKKEEKESNEDKEQKQYVSIFCLLKLTNKLETNLYY